MSSTILIVDDEAVQRRLLENSITKMGYRTVVCESGDAALSCLGESTPSTIDVVVLDLVMPGIDGMDVLAEMRKLGLDIPVIVQTAQGGIETVVKAMRAGAVDFCVKPVSPERLRVSLQNALKLGAMEQAVQTIRKNSDGTFSFEDMIASSPVMEKVIKLGRKAAASSIPILIEGESGVGKEVLAKAIQGESERKGKSFVTVNCGALPENLVESILFGHEKGSFTGAVGSHVGKFKEADGGTLFLDEVGELSLDVQVKLLRAIQEGEVDPVGAKRPVKTDFRLISATNRDMIELVNSGQFREDLYYRLNVFPVLLPSLKERKSDIAALIKHFTAKVCLEEGRRHITGIRHDALAMLEAYDWPGNIRQLENTIFRGVVLCEGEQLTIEEFPQVALAMGEEPIPNYASNSVVSHSANSILNDEDSIDQRSLFSMLSDNGDVRPMDEAEAEMIRFAIEHHKGRMTRVAQSLNIGRSTLYRRLKELDIDPAKQLDLSCNDAA